MHANTEDAMDLILENVSASIATGSKTEPRLPVVVALARMRASPAREAIN